MKTVKEAIEYFESEVTPEDLILGNTDETDFPFVKCLETADVPIMYYIYRCCDGYVGVRFNKDSGNIDEVSEFVEYTHTVTNYRPKTEYDQ